MDLTMDNTAGQPTAAAQPAPAPSVAPPARRRLASPRIASLVLLVAILGGWEAIVRVSHVRRVLVPPVSDIFVALWRGFATGPMAKDGLWYHTGITMVEILLGFFVGSAIGLAIGIV